MGAVRRTAVAALPERLAVLEKQLPAMLLALTFVALSGSAYAQQDDRRWQCSPMSSISSFAMSRGGLVLNNFYLHESIGMFSRHPYVELTLSAVNRGPDARFLSVQFLGINTAGDVIIAMSAEPILGMVSDNSNEQIKVSVNSRANEFALISHFCVRADGDFGSQ